MRYEINIPEEQVQEVDRQVDDAYHTATHNLGNAIARGCNEREIERLTEIAKAARIVQDIIHVVIGAQRDIKNGDDPNDSNYGDDVCCRYVPERQAIEA